MWNMRQHFNLDIHKDDNDNDNDKVYTYGRTKDIALRSGQHQRKYGKLKDNTFGLTVFSYVDERNGTMTCISIIPETTRPNPTNATESSNIKERVRKQVTTGKDYELI
jgi:hypothetical protein